MLPVLRCLQFHPGFARRSLLSLFTHAPSASSTLVRRLFPLAPSFCASPPARRNDAAAAEITALAAGAGPPAKRIATRLKEWSGLGGGESVFAKTLPVGCFLNPVNSRGILEI